MNQYNNDTLPFQNKIVAIEIPQPVDDIYKVIELVADIFKTLYGIVILIYGQERISVVTSKQVPQKTILTASRLIESKTFKEEVDIIPFPRK